MPEKNDEARVMSKTLQPVKTRYPLVGGPPRAHRALVSVTGRTTLNVASSKALDQHATAAGLDIHKYLTTFAADPAKGLIAIYAAGGEAEGAMPIRRTKEDRVVSFHLGGVFLEHPSLKPQVAVRCLIYPDKDDNGKETLFLALQSALPVRRGARSAARANPEVNPEKSQPESTPRLTTPTQGPEKGESDE